MKWFHRGRKKRDCSVIPIGELGLDPANPDCDGDLLTDGFECVNKLDPKSPDSIGDDYDADELDNLQEQIWNTDPLNADSDGDGVPDGTEVEQGSDPLDPGDGGVPSKTLATVRLTGV